MPKRHICKYHYKANSTTTFTRESIVKFYPFSTACGEKHIYTYDTNTAPQQFLEPSATCCSEPHIYAAAEIAQLYNTYMYMNSFKQSELCIGYSGRIWFSAALCINPAFIVWLNMHIFVYVHVYIMATYQCISTCYIAHVSGEKSSYFPSHFQE